MACRDATFGCPQGGEHFSALDLMGVCTHKGIVPLNGAERQNHLHAKPPQPEPEDSLWRTGRPERRARQFARDTDRLRKRLIPHRIAATIRAGHS
jgi:hypothetical protein